MADETAPEAPLDDASVQACLKAVAARVTAARLKAGLTRRDLAERSGVTRQVVYYVEDGVGFTITTLLKLAMGLGVQPASLVPDLMTDPENTEVQHAPEAAADRP